MNLLLTRLDEQQRCWYVAVDAKKRKLIGGLKNYRRAWCQTPEYVKLYSST